jgi:hypothetical protein
MSPYLIVQENEKKAKNLTTLGIWLMVIGFGIFICIAWSGSTEPLLTPTAILGLLAGIVGIKFSLNGHDLKSNTNRTFDALVLANTRYKKMKEDSVSSTYKNTIKHLFKKN